MGLWSRLANGMRRFFGEIGGSSTLSPAQQWLIDWTREV
jgi:hypothetical protein